jgi:hypothetical protein
MNDEEKRNLEEEIRVIDNLIKTITAREEVKNLIMPFDELGREYHNKIYTML